MNKAVCFLAIFSCLVIPKSHAQTTVNYTMQTGNFNSLLTERNNNPPYTSTYNNGATELGNYANGGSFGNTPGAAAFQTFTTTGNGNSGAVRALQVGDTFTITGFTSANPSAGGYLGISFRDSTTYSNFFSSTDSATEARFQLDNTGGWKVYNNGSAVDSSLGSNADRTFTIKVTSDNTFNATIGGNTYYDLSMAAGGGKIDSFSIYTFGDNNQNSFWKNASLTSTGTVELGYAAASGTRTFSTVISDGLAANSTSATSANAVFIGGDAGSQVNLTAANTYTGQTTVNSAARLEVQNAGALGGTSNGTTVSNGGALSLYQATGGITIDNEALNLSGVGVSGANGALRNTGGNNAWNGTVTLGANTRINADTTGSSGSLTIGGNISGGANVLFLGAQGGSAGNTGGDITLSGVISGAGATHNSTITSLFKDGAGTLTLLGANNYTGGTTISEGTLQLGNGSTTGALSTSSSIINNGTLAFNRSDTVQQGVTFANVISGSGAVTTIGTGLLALTGNNTYSGSTTVATGGRLGVYSTAALGSTAAGTIVNSGGQLRLENVTIGAEALTISGTGQGASAGAIRGGSGSSTYGGKVTLAANATVFTSGVIGLTFDVASGDAFDLGNNTLTFDGSGTHQVNDGIAGTGGLIKTGSGLLAVSGTSSYNGTTTVSNGTLRADAAAGGRAFGNLSAVTLSIGGAGLNPTALNLNNFNQTIGSLAGGGTIANGGSVTLGSGTLTTGGDNTSTSFAGVISGTGGLTKTGSGTMSLAAANNYSGATAVNNGLLKILSGGSISSSSTTVNNGGTLALDLGGSAGSVQVNSGGLLKGSGSAGAVTFQSGSFLNPGNSPGTLTAASATVLGGSTYNWEISALTGTAGTNWDLFSVGGLLNMDGVTSANRWNLVVTGDSGFAGWTDTNSYSYVFAQAASVSGFSSTVGTDVTSLFNITTSGIASKPNASFNVNGDFKVVVGSANGFTTLNLMAVPEPSSGSLLLAGIGSLIVLRRFRKKA
jgi:fibronectin-binding autotransporter adhesin